MEVYNERVANLSIVLFHIHFTKFHCIEYEYILSDSKIQSHLPINYLEYNFRHTGTYNYKTRGTLRTTITPEADRQTDRHQGMA